MNRSWQLVSLLLLLAHGINAEEPSDKPAQRHKPLFPVALDEPFPDPEKSFHEVRRLILEHYYSDDINGEALYRAAIDGMLRHISPPEHPELGKLWKPKDYDKVRDGLNGVRVSIGIQSSYNVNDGSLTVTGVEDGSPADGVLAPHDRIVRIDDEALKGKAVADINALLEGDEGSEIKLTVVRDINVEDITLTRSEYKTKNLIVTRLPNDVALIEIRRITSGLSEELKTELIVLEAQRIHHLVLDLRHNNGGVFIESLRTAELFLKKKDVLLRTLDRKKKLQTYVSDNEQPYDCKMVVIVNKNTASSCEIIAGALQDHGAAIVIGEKTYGKGVFEKTFTLENNYRVKFIIGAMYTPRGKAWQSKGILPDFAVSQTSKKYLAVRELDADNRLKHDVPLITAYKLLRR